MLVYNLRYSLTDGNTSTNCWLRRYTAFCYQTMKDAVLDVMKIAERGDVVLLSPGGASFDEFDSYVARGQVFKELVSGTYQE